MKTELFLNPLEESRVVAAITEAEKKTSGEIRVYISQKKRHDALTAAKNRFEKLGMTKTALRNGILVYVAPVSQKFAVVGDIGIHQKCGQEFWETISAEMGKLFKEGLFADGLVKAVQVLGNELALHFPFAQDDKNELPNDILRD